MSGPLVKAVMWWNLVAIQIRDLPSREVITKAKTDVPRELHLIIVIKDVLQISMAIWPVRTLDVLLQYFRYFVHRETMILSLEYQPGRLYEEAIGHFYFHTSMELGLP